ncbi:MAG: DUF1761 domain-containing protein [Candidatus Paceibacterota bacterium]|jgi:hypothetical protein
MFFADINLYVVVIAAVISMIIGSVWYSPVAFGKPFIAAKKYTPEEIAQNSAKSMWKAYLGTFVSCLIMAYALATIINSIFVSGIYGLAIVGLVIAIGIIAPVKFNDSTFSGDSWTLFFINVGYQAVSVVAQVLIIGLFS